MKANVLTPEVVADAARRVRERVAEAQRAPAPDAKGIAALEAEIVRLVDAVASGALTRPRLPFANARSAQNASPRDFT